MSILSTAFALKVVRSRTVRAAWILFLIGASVAADSATCQPGVPPPLLTNPEEAREFARKNLPPGVKPGDILTDRPGFPERDVAGVYGAVLDALYTDGRKRPPFVVLNELAEGRGVSCDKSPCPFIPGHKSKIDTLTMQDFRRATLTRRRIRPDFKYRLPVRFLTRDVRDQLPAIGDALPASVSRGSGPAEVSYWMGFMARYPGAWGAATMTQVGFNPRHTEALLQVRHACGAYCGSTEIMFLRKANGRWRVVERLTESAQDTDLGHKDLRFRGIGARKPLVEVRAEFVADSLRKMALPRAIRGTITNSATGVGIPLARISIHAGNTPNTPWTQAYTDAAGKYVVENPPVDGIGLMVYCPKTSRRPGDLISVAGTDMRPGLDTTVNFSINLSMCDDPAETGLSAQPRGLQAPVPPLLHPREIEAHKFAKYPTLEEAGVYTAVLNGMWGTQPGELTLVLHRTRSLCVAVDCAERYRRRIRSIPEVVLSTMENFLSVRGERVSIPANFAAPSEFVSSYATRSDIRLIGDSALKYLEGQSGFSDSTYAAGGGGQSRAFWEVLHQAYPTAKGIVSFSPVAFSPRHKQAMVEATRSDINSFMPSDIFVLNNVGGEWRIVARFQP
jgi:hypothetical protein